MFVRCSGSTVVAVGGLRSTTHAAANCQPAAVLRTISSLQCTRLRLRQLPPLSPRYTPTIAAPAAAPSLSLAWSHHTLTTTTTTTVRRFSTAKANFVNIAEAAAACPILLADIPVLGSSKVTLRQQKQQKRFLSFEIGTTGAGALTTSKKKKKKKKGQKATKATKTTLGNPLGINLLGPVGLKVKLKTTAKATTKTTVKKKKKEYSQTPFYYTTSPVLRPKAALAALRTTNASKMSQHTQPAPSPYSNYAILTNFRRLPYKTKALTRTDEIALAPYFDLDPFFTQTGRRQWEIYHDTDPNGKPVLLITLRQAWAFLDYVKQETGIEVPRHPKSNYCYRKKELRPGETAIEPVKVATIGTRTEWEDVTMQWAAGTTGRGGEGGMTNEEKEAKKQRHKERQEMKRRGFTLQVQRATKLLGFTLPEGNVVTPKVIQEGSEVKEGEDGGGVKIVTETSETITTHDTEPKSKKGDDFEDVPFFVCVDCESWERNHGAITEIGIATLDMGALPPSQTRPTYEAIKSLIKYRHIRVREHRQLRNGQFVPDAADLFDFGKTEFWGLSGLPEVLSEAFTPPPLPQQGSTTGKPKRRTIAFVGHDAATDIKYLTQCKFDARTFVRETLATLDADSANGISNGGERGMEVFDTADMYKTITGEVNAKGLGKMVEELGLEPWNLHNAGNDAAYTLMGFVKMCEKPTREQDQQEGGVKL